MASTKCFVLFKISRPFAVISAASGYDRIVNWLLGCSNNIIPVHRIEMLETLDNHTLSLQSVLDRAV